MTWFDASRKGNCSQCGAPTAEGDRLWAVRKGYYVCEPDGLLREASKESHDQGALESSVVESLKLFPPEVMGTALAQTALYLARQLDYSEVNPRDVPGFSKEIRETIRQLEAMYPPEPEDDATAEANKRREIQMSKLAEGDWDDK